jgi:predicted Zn-dependent peptidase
VSAPAGFERIEFVGEQHLAEVIGSWPVQTAFTNKDRATLEVLVKILEQRLWLDVRATLGLAYSPTADFTPYVGFPNFALIQAAMDCDPGDSRRVAQLVEDLADRLAQKGATELELIGARGILSGQVRQWFHSAGFLISLIPRAQERPETLDEAIALRNGLIDQVTLEDVNGWARKALPRRNSRTAAIVPKQFIGIFQTGGP